MSIKINYKVLGLEENGSEAPLIWLIHGAGGDLFHFDPVVPILVEAGYRVLVNDVRFHGLSQPETKGEYPFLFSDVMQDMNNVLKEVKEQHYPENPIRLFFCGFSMGCMISLLFASDKGHAKIWEKDQIELKGIVLLAAGIPNLEVARQGWDIFRTRQATPEVLQFARSAIVDSPITDFGKKDAKRAMDLISEHALYECLVAVAELLPSPSESPEPYIPLTTVPMLQIIPAQDPYVRVEMELLHSINLEHGIRSELSVIENSGHFVTLDQGLEAGIQTRDFCNSCL
ncbi:Alpha/Beta hydrolase protein [Pilaira anomala]|nr:Alpha/Beta hydrolase protein [Pilaira anomala]